MSRERVMATFWPELPTTRAQGGLRNALYFVRQALGSDLVVGHGSSVGVAPERLSCDAVDLLSEVPDRPLAELLDLYRGEFLDALHVSGTPDFDRWVDRTRAALGARASEIAWELSERAEARGEWISAAGYARRATDLSVDVEAATRRLIALLGRAGDRAAAILESERLTSLLDSEYGVSPSPETVALIRTVREGRLPDTPSDSTGEQRPRYRSLAVLPFEDLSAGSGAHLAGGLAENVVTELSRLHGIRVVSRTSVRRFATDPPASVREVHDLLGVDLVLEGSVQVQGDRVRIVVQLVDARLDDHLWSEAYDRRLTDLFEIQSDVVLRVVRALETELSPMEHERIRRLLTTSVEAYELYLEGRRIWSHRKPEDASRAASMFQRALDVAPDFPHALVGLADAWLVRAATGAGSLAHAVREARATIDEALARDPGLGEARATLGLVLTFFDWDHPAAGRELWRSTELAPGYATAHQWYGQFLVAHGREDQGLAELGAALDLDPLSPAVNEGLGVAFYHLGRIDEAASRLRQTLALDPGFWRARLGLSLCHAAEGDLRGATGELLEMWSAGAYGADREEAEEAAVRFSPSAREALEYLLECARSRIGEISAIRVLEVVILMLLKRHEEAVEALETAREDGTLALVATMYAPVLEPLAGRARFRALMDETGLLLPRWRGTGRRSR